MKKCKCPVKWFCKALSKWIVVSEEAVYSEKSGWLCDCGIWLKKPDSGHVDMTFGERVFYPFKE